MNILSDLLPWWVKLIALAVVIGSMVTWYEIKIHKAYEKGKAEVQVLLDIEKTNHKNDITLWKTENEQAEAENNRLVGKFIALVAARNQETKQNQAKNKQLTAQINQRITSEIKPQAVVVAPAVFRSLYNSAVAGTTGSKGQTGTDEVSTSDSTGVSGKVETFDAIAFTQTLTKNVLQYNELATRCDALVDIVKEFQNGLNSSEFERNIDQDGRDSTNRVASSHQ